MAHPLGQPSRVPYAPSHPTRALIAPPPGTQIAADLLSLAVGRLEAEPVGATAAARKLSRKELDDQAHAAARSLDWTAFEWFVLEGAREAVRRHDPAQHQGTDARAKGRAISAAVRREVADRDRYTCRYCGLRVVTSAVLTTLERRLPAALPLWPASMGPQSLTVHPMQLAMRLTWDHVVPWSAGGDSSATNVVATCGACNFNKKECTLAELSLLDPRSTPPQQTTWSGLDGRLGSKPL